MVMTAAMLEGKSQHRGSLRAALRDGGEEEALSIGRDLQREQGGAARRAEMWFLKNVMTGKIKTLCLGVQASCFYGDELCSN